jgi:hypothetical protein
MWRDRQSWPAEKAEKWLIFLAHHLEYIIGTPDFAWWQLVRGVPGLTGGLIAGITAAIVAGSLTWVAAGPAIGLAGGAAALVLVGLRAFEDRAPLGGFRYRFPGIAKIVLCVILAAFLALFLGSAAKAASGTDAGVATALSVGFVTVLLSVVGAGLKMVTFDLSVAATPHAILARDRLTVIISAVSSGLAIATLAALLSGFWSRQVADSLIAGFCTFIVIAFVFTLSRGAWLPWVLTRTWLAFCGKLPWRLTAFLADAHKRGVLRQVGAVYQFRHAELQQRLGSRQT